VVQFKDVKRNKFIAVAVDGEGKEFGALAKRKRSGTSNVGEHGFHSLLTSWRARLFGLCHAH
jgi:hypothetical protein